MAPGCYLPSDRCPALVFERISPIPGFSRIDAQSLRRLRIENGGRALSTRCGASLGRLIALHGSSFDFDHLIQRFAVRAFECAFTSRPRYLHNTAQHCTTLHLVGGWGAARFAQLE